MSNALSNLKWATDYLVTCHRSDYEFVGQVGNVNIDHNVWCRCDARAGGLGWLHGRWGGRASQQHRLSCRADGLRCSSRLFLKQFCW